MFTVSFLFIYVCVCFHFFKFCSADFKALVVKATGIAAGKGVIVAKDIEEACDAVDMMLVHKKFGDAGKTIVVEELLEGEEVSVSYTFKFTPLQSSSLLSNL